MNLSAAARRVAMGTTFCVFLFSLISPMYLFFGTNSLSNIVYGRIPGMGLQFRFFDRIAISSFFMLMMVFFLSHIFFETGIRRFVCAGAFVYSAMYFFIIELVGLNGLVVFDFPIISIPLWAVLFSKFFILIPAAFFCLIAFNTKNSTYVRVAAAFHAMCLVLIGMIKVFEMLFPANLRIAVFDISTALYLISLSMTTFFMYRKYYDEE